MLTHDEVIILHKEWSIQMVVLGLNKFDHIINIINIQK
jgi:hypothetical protein